MLAGSYQQLVKKGKNLPSNEIGALDKVHIRSLARSIHPLVHAAAKSLK
jgi:hypothetical protein